MSVIAHLYLDMPMQLTVLIQCQTYYVSKS